MILSQVLFGLVWWEVMFHNFFSPQPKSRYFSCYSLYLILVLCSSIQQVFFLLLINSRNGLGSDLMISFYLKIQNHFIRHIFLNSFLFLYILFLLKSGVRVKVLDQFSGYGCLLLHDYFCTLMIFHHMQLTKFQLSHYDTHWCINTD